MICVTVKKGKRTILEIGDDWCRFYPESKKAEPRQFQLRDIAQVERRDGVKQTFFLRNAGSIYAQVEPGDKVTLRWENSVLGITYYEVDLLDEKQMKIQ